MTIQNQVGNKNYLSPIGFNFKLQHAPKVDFFCNSANIPGISLGVAVQPNPLKMIDVPGDILTYEDLILSFFVDSNMENYMEIHNWMTALGFPNNFGEFMEFQKEKQISEKNDNFPELSDAVLTILNSNYQPSAKVKFSGLFPFNLSTLQFDTRERDYTYFTAQVSFKYTIYSIVGPDGKPL